MRSAMSCVTQKGRVPVPKLPLADAATKCLATVRNGTAWLPCRCHAQGMLRNKSKRESESDSSTRARVNKEMAKPRMAKSARIAEQNLKKALTLRLQSQPKTSNATINLDSQPTRREMVDLDLA